MRSRQAGVKVLAGDWTNGDPAITRFLESRGRAGVPYYLWYAPGKAARGAAADPHAVDAYFPRSGRRSARRALPHFLAADPGLEHLRSRQRLRIDRGRVAVDEDEVGPFAGLQRADPVLGEAGVGRAAGVGVERLRRRSAARDGIHPPGGWPLMSCRLIAGGEAGEGFGLSTGKSVPNASRAPLFSTRLPRIGARQAGSGRAAPRPSAGRWSGGSAASRR